MKYVAEFVSPGHPDRLCDSIVESIVDFVIKEDEDALCGIECAVHTNKVFIDGRIAAGKDKTVISKECIKEIVREVYENAGYGANGFWHPFEDELEIIFDLCIEKLSDDERNLRKYSDDQNIVIGYANNNRDTKYVPVEQYLSNLIGNHIYGYNSLSHFKFGPDFKVLVQINDDNNSYSWDRLTISIEHNYEIQKDYSTIYDDIKEIVIRCLNLNLPQSLSSLKNIDPLNIYVNGAGDFIQGGPEGDNGLSGKKLVVDFYGPRIPIGGGAICGKDPHKIDYCGAMIARKLALDLVIDNNFKTVYTRLAWSPGEETPYLIEAYEEDVFGIKRKIDDSLLPPKDYFSITSIFNTLNLKEKEKADCILYGYFINEK